MSTDGMYRCTDRQVRRLCPLAAGAMILILVRVASADDLIISRPYGVLNYQGEVLARAVTVNNSEMADVIARPVTVFNYQADTVSRSTTVSNFQDDINSRAYTANNYLPDVVSRGVIVTNCPFGDLSCLNLANADCNANGVFDLCDTSCIPQGGNCTPGNCGQFADCNLNGVPDWCEAQNGQMVICASDDCNHNGLLDALETAVTVQFSAPAALPAGADPYGVTAGDLDGNGDADLAAANSQGDSCSVYFNAGGAFSVGATLAVGASPRSIAIADYDGDGRADLAVACFNANAVSILRNLGNGNFAAAVSYSAGPGPQCVVAGDLDGDGRRDLVVADTGMVSNTNTIAILKNLGASGFAPPVLYVVGLKPRAVTLLDVDQDGRLDIATADSDPDTVTILHNLGNLQFEATGSYSVQRFPFALTPGDWDGDGRPDLAVANSVAGTLSLLRNDGSGGFSALGAALQSESAPRAVQGIDVDGDGRKDILVACYGTSHVLYYRNLGGGMFAPAVVYSSPDFGGCHGLAVADFDGSGRQDFAVANRNSGNMAVARNASFSLAPDCNHNGLPDECDIQSGFSQDVNGNGVPDSCEVSGTCATCSGDVTGDHWVNGRDIQAFVACVLAGSGTGGCACADVNGSGAASAADVSPFVARLLGGGACP